MCILIIYSISTSINAIAGSKLSHLAWKETRRVFERCAMMQLCLSFYVLRFAPIFTQIFTMLYDDFGLKLVDTLLYIIDKTFALALIFCTLSLYQVAFDQWYIHKKKAIALSIAIGILGIFLLSTYPAHLALFGQEWWECIQHRYPEQNVGMVGYIYVPATVTFSLILFGATLYQRGILSASSFGMSSIIIVTFCLIGTVLSQELHIPNVSTQRIYLPCTEPVSGTWEAQIVNALDFSFYARNVLRITLNVHFEDL